MYPTKLLTSQEQGLGFGGFFKSLWPGLKKKEDGIH